MQPQLLAFLPALEKPKGRSQPRRASWGKSDFGVGVLGVKLRVYGLGFGFRIEG